VKDLVTIEEIREAAAGLVGIAIRTPLLEVRALSELAGHPVYLKLENQQPPGAFKVRGAWTAIRRLSDEEKRQGVITYSSGNHGQAVAYAADRLGIRAVVVMPETVSIKKLEGVKKWGGEVELAGRTSEDRLKRCQEIVEEEGLKVIPPFDAADVVCGQATVGLEIVEDLPEVAEIVAPVGGGGLAGGISRAVSLLKPDVTVTAVEPEGAPAYHRALEAGQPVRLDSTASVADGLLPLSIGKLPFEFMRNVARSVLVSDESIVEATKWLFQEQDILAETSGAATTAAVRSGRLEPSGPTVLVVSGGNIDPATIAALKTVAA